MLLSAFIARCRIAFDLLLEDRVSDEVVEIGDPAPHGYDRVPVYAAPVVLDRGWSYTPVVGWELRPTVEPVCTCPSCAGRRPELGD